MAERHRGRRTAGLVLLSAALFAASLAVRPHARQDAVIVRFPAGVTDRQAVTALAALDATVLWTDRSRGVWAVRMPDPGEAWHLYDHGAVLVTDASSYSAS